MRLFFSAIVLAAAGYLGWVFFHESRDTPPSSFAEKEAPPGSVTTAARPAPATLQIAPPGVFYATERVAVQTATGVKALHRGEEVKLMYRNKDGTMLVTNGRDEFVVKPSSLTKNRPQP